MARGTKSAVVICIPTTTSPPLMCSIVQSCFRFVVELVAGHDYYSAAYFGQLSDFLSRPFLTAASRPELIASWPTLVRPT